MYELGLNSKCQHKNGVFKVPLMDRWLVIVTGELYEKLRTAPEQSLSMWGAMIDVRQPFVRYRKL